jgi:hypothetical protein
MSNNFAFGGQNYDALPNLGFRFFNLDSAVAFVMQTEGHK